MQAKIKEAMMHKIENAVYSAWIEELLQRGVNAVEAHRQATAALVIRMRTLQEAWLTVDWLPDDVAYRPVQPDPLISDPLLRRLMLGGK